MSSRDIPVGLSDYTQRGARKYGNSRQRVIGPVLVICAIVSVLVAANYWMNHSKIYPGVTVGDVALGGKTPEEAREVLDGRAGGTLREVRLSGGPEELTLPAEEAGVSFDAASTVDRAYAVGREGSVFERLGERLRAAWGTASVRPAVDYDREAIRARVENLAGRANAEPRNAYVNMSGARAEVVESREGYTVDVAATLENTDAAIEDLSGEAEIAGETLEPEVSDTMAQAAAEEAERVTAGPVSLTAEGEKWELMPREIGETLSFTPEGDELRVGLDRERLEGSLSDVYEDLMVEPVEAGFEVEGDEVSVTESRTGKEIEEEKLLEELETGLLEGQREYEVPVVTAEPELTTEEAERMKPTEMLGSYRTDYSVVPDDGARVENLDLSSDAVDGTLLAPGEVFSMNEKVAGLDYNEAKVIVGGAETEADGGGLCQVTSTLYNAANFAGLDVIERIPHSAQLPYIRPGMDATVWWGGPGEEDDLDMKFRNTTDSYLLLREYVAADGYVHAEIWGRPNDVDVEMYSEPTNMDEEGSEWITYQKVEKDGEVLFDGVLHKDSYEPLVDEHGKEIPPSEVPVAPVDP